MKLKLRTHSNEKNFFLCRKRKTQITKLQGDFEFFSVTYVRILFTNEFNEKKYELRFKIFT